MSVKFHFVLSIILVVLFAILGFVGIFTGVASFLTVAIVGMIVTTFVFVGRIVAYIFS